MFSFFVPFRTTINLPPPLIFRVTVPYIQALNCDSIRISTERHPTFTLWIFLNLHYPPSLSHLFFVRQSLISWIFLYLRMSSRRLWAGLCSTAFEELSRRRILRGSRHRRVLGWRGTTRRRGVFRRKSRPGRKLSWGSRSGGGWKFGWRRRPRGELGWRGSRTGGELGWRTGREGGRAAAADRLPDRIEGEVNPRAHTHTWAIIVTIVITVIRLMTPGTRKPGDICDNSWIV